jgi:two-component system chemotaxis sensor kinase CheA
MLGTGNEPLRLFRELEELGNLSIKADTAKIPSLADMDPEDCYLAWELTLESDVAKERITEIFEWVEDDCELSIMPLQLQSEQTSQATANIEDNTAKANLAETNKKAIAPESSSIRVSIDKVDALINMVGELVITQSMISQFNCDVEDFDASHIEKLKAGLTLLERNTRELQESVMRIRMLPISFAFNRFPRMVRDMSQKLGKEIVLKMTGEQTELDKTVMEKIGDPLVHLVRNSLDHGIEKPDERVAAGKSATGTIELNAYHKGGNIIIEVTDDGAGLNKEKILNKARDRGLVDGDNLTDDNIYDLIFQPGFSTAETVSDVSGRGVGMDVVKRNIRELGGSVDVTSVDGKGSKFTVRLPLTLAILDGQLVRVGNEVYIMPLVSIVESIQIQKENINSIVGKSEVYNIRDEYIPIVRMHDVFTVKSVSQEQQDNLLVIVEGDGHKVGLVVDDLLGQQQVVIKSLETNYQRLKGISGGTILGDGTVALILDVEGIIALSKEGPLSGNKLKPLQSESLAVA